MDRRQTWAKTGGDFVCRRWFSEAAIVGQVFPKWRRTCLIAPPARLGRSRATGERLSGHRPNGQAFRQTAEQEVVWLEPEPHRLGYREIATQRCGIYSQRQALTQPGPRVMRSCATQLLPPRIA